MSGSETGEAKGGVGASARLWSAPGTAQGPRATGRAGWVYAPPLARPEVTPLSRHHTDTTRVQGNSFGRVATHARGCSRALRLAQARDGGRRSAPLAPESLMADKAQQRASPSVEI